jgi:diphthamide synthase (EF-2-diphthine--ammonia ligase)
MSWSTGKDSALALHRVREAGEIDVVALMTTMTTVFGRVSMHGVREALLDAQCERVPASRSPSRHRARTRCTSARWRACSNARGWWA